jgi:hypothetical protein
MTNLMIYDSLEFLWVKKTLNQEQRFLLNEAYIRKVSIAGSVISRYRPTPFETFDMNLQLSSIISHV